LDLVQNKAWIETDNIIVSIIIPAHNEEAVLKDCLESIIEGDFPKHQYEIIIIDDGSTDRTYEIANSYQRKFDNILALSKTNGGKASAQNYGLKVAKGKYILVTDADVVVNKNWVPRMVRNLKKYDIVIGGYYAKKPKHWLEKTQNAHYLVKFKYGGIKEIPAVGANNAFKKEIINITGGFNENITSITSDFIERGKSKGLKIYYDPEVWVYTKCTKNICGFFKQKLRWREAGTSSLDAFCYTYGLSLFLFGSLLVSIYSREILFIASALLITYAVSFSIYLTPFYRLLMSREDRCFAKYFLLYELIEIGIRLILVPYIGYRLLVPRVKPTFEARRG